jgi:hypothetical protein
MLGPSGTRTSSATKKMISSRALHVYLGTTAALGGYYAGRTAYTNPRWSKDANTVKDEGMGHGREALLVQGLPPATIITRSLTTMVGTAMGALAGPFTIPYQAAAGILEGVHDWAEERKTRGAKFQEKTQEGTQQKKGQKKGEQELILTGV